MTTSPVKFLITLVLSVVAGIVAGATAQAASIDPTNNEFMGQLTIKTRPVAWIYAPSMYFSSSADGISMGFDKAVRIHPTNTGTLNIQFSTGATDRTYTQLLPISVTAKQKVEVIIPQLEVAWNPSEFNIEIGPRPRMAIWPAQAAAQLYKTPVDDAIPSELKIGIPLLAGQYEIRALPSRTLTPGPLTYQTVDLAAAAGTTGFAKATVTAKDFPEPGTITMNIPSTRFQDAYESTCFGTSGASLSLSTVQTAGMIPSDVILSQSFSARDTKTTIRGFAVDDIGKPMFYTYHVGPFQNSVAMQAGKDTVVTLERVDVNNVTVTKENGTTYTTPATYKVERLNKSGAWERLTWPATGGRCPYPVYEFQTPSSLILAPGQYQFTLEYRTAFGVEKQVHKVEIK